MMFYIDGKTGRVSLTVEPLTKKGTSQKDLESIYSSRNRPKHRRPKIIEARRLIEASQAKETGKKYRKQVKDAKGA